MQRPCMLSNRSQQHHPPLPACCLAAASALHSAAMSTLTDITPATSTLCDSLEVQPTTLRKIARCWGKSNTRTCCARTCTCTRATHKASNSCCWLDEPHINTHTSAPAAAAMSHHSTAHTRWVPHGPAAPLCTALLRHHHPNDGNLRPDGEEDETDDTVFVSFVLEAFAEPSSRQLSPSAPALPAYSLCLRETTCPR